MQEREQAYFPFKPLIYLELTVHYISCKAI